MTGLGIVCMHLLEVLFFIGLAGCSATVVFSWISIFTSGFSDKDDYELAEEHAMTHPAHRATAHPRHAEQRSSAATLSAPVRESLSR